MNRLDAKPKPRGLAPERSATTSLPARAYGPPVVVQPAQPPGRLCRKARAFGDQIRQLHAQGYSFGLIRDALAEAGLIVSRSTVWREASRPRLVDPDDVAHVTGRPQPIPRELSRGDGSVTRSAVQSRPTEPRGKDVAAAFMKDRITNPLLRKDKP